MHFYINKYGLSSLIDPKWTNRQIYWEDMWYINDCNFYLLLFFDKNALNLNEAVRIVQNNDVKLKNEIILGGRISKQSWDTWVHHH